MDVQWVKLRSWHALRPDTHFAAATFCGRAAEGIEVVDKLPAGKSCELCLRIVGRNADAHEGAV
jgi:hypothetical protein